MGIVRVKRKKGGKKKERKVQYISYCGEKIRLEMGSRMTSVIYKDKKWKIPTRAVEKFKVVLLKDSYDMAKDAIEQGIPVEHVVATDISDAIEFLDEYDFNPPWMAK